MNDIEYCWFKNKLQQLILPSILIKTDVHTKYTNKYITTTNRISIYIYKVAYYLMQQISVTWAPSMENLLKCNIDIETRDFLSIELNDLWSKKICRPNRGRQKLRRYPPP